MLNEDEAINLAAKPHLIASAETANEVLGFLNAHLADLRMEVSELELAADLRKNELLRQENKTVALKESEWKISDIYKHWKKQAGLLSDMRAYRRNLERHANLLFEQEKYGQKSGGYSRVI